ncbi:MAG TPA: septum site-determining protein MinC [Rubrivivax sp.]|nr:septum site-determining protein MinC [Rubrivivax sp.]
MAVVSRSGAPATAAFALRSAALTLVSVLLKTTDLGRLAEELDAGIGATPDLFDDDPVAIDLAPMREAAETIDFEALIALLRRHRMRPIFARGGSPAQMAEASAAGLAEAPEGTLPARAEPTALDVPAAAAPASPVAPQAVATRVIDKPLRSGQQVYAKGGDVVVLAAVSAGAEVIADGSIHVYAPLRGRAIAGAKGCEQARIFTTCMEAQLVSIAGTYRTTEVPWPAEVLGQPASVRLEADRLIVEPLKA